MISAVLDEDTGNLMEYRKLMKKRITATCTATPIKNIGRLAQGMSGLVDGTNIIFFIEKKLSPSTGRETSPMGEYMWTTAQKIATPTAHNKEREEIW